MKSTFSFLLSMIMWLLKGILSMCRLGGKGRELETITTPSPKDLPPIYRASTDVIYYLSRSVLFMSDAAALAMTCKSLWRAVDGKQILAELNNPRVRKPATVFSRAAGTGVNHEESRLALLERQEIHFPKHLLCYTCAVFHRRRGIKRRMFPYEFDRRAHTVGPIPNRFMGESRVLLPHDGIIYMYDITFWQAKEQMNYHRFGKDYGRPLTFKHIDFSFSSSQFWSYSTFRTKVISDELILKTDYSHLFRRNYPKREELPGIVGVDLHPHLPCNMSGGGPERCPQVKDDTRRPFFRCEDCSTEIRRVVNPTFDDEFGEFRATTWQNLGPCQSEFDPKWAPATRYEVCRRVKHKHPKKLRYAPYFDDWSPVRLARGRSWLGRLLH